MKPIEKPIEKPVIKISVMIIEDNRLLRQGITSMINERPDMKVVGSFGDTEKSLSKIEELNPDVVLIDLGLRSRNSLHAVKLIRHKSAEVKIIVMDLMPVEDDIIDFVKAGASGFILKDAKVPEFLKTIQSVASGKKVLPPNMTDTLFNQIIERAISTFKSPTLRHLIKMTKRERQVVELIADGLSNKEIGKALHLSPFTIKSHVHNILEKMALRSRVQIAAYAHKIKEHKDHK
jgi:DNA-binding NarL/FixJ family response regulator